MSAPARRELVRYMVDKGLSQRRALRVVSMSPSAYRYEPASDRNCVLKEKIIALAQRHRRYGAGMIYLKLCQAGEIQQARVIVETWRREYNEERPKKSLGGLTPSAYAQTLIQKSVKLTSDSKAW